MVLAALVLFPKLNRPLLDPDEGRQAEVAREMLAHEDLLVPRLRGKPYLEKPPLQYWLTIAAYSVLGIEAWCARLIPAVSSWLLVLVTYLWARRALGERPALLGGLVLCLTPGFVLLGRLVLLDALLALCVVTAWYSGHVAVCRRDLRQGWWLASAAACGLGTLAKGPVALALVGPPLLAYQLLTTTAARPRWSTWVTYGAVVLAVASPWYAVMAVRQPGYLQDFLWRNNVVRYVNAFDHAQPWWFYLPILMAVTLPWPVLWYGVWRFLRSRDASLIGLRTPGLGLCVLAAGWGLLFFSLSTCKSPPYLAPLLSPLALLTGTCLDAVLFQPAAESDRRLRQVRQQLPNWGALLLFLLAFVGTLSTGVLGWQSRPAVGTQSAVIAFAGIAWLWGARRVTLATAWKACTAATVAFILFVTHVLAPSFTERRTPSKAAHAALRAAAGRDDPLILYGRDWQSALFYLRRESALQANESDLPVLLNYLHEHPETLVVIESGRPLDDFLSALPVDLETCVRRPGRLGQAALVVVRRLRGPAGEEGK